MAGSRAPQKPSVLLDWFNVSYRTLFLAAFVLLVAGGGASYYAWLKLVYEGSPKAEARGSINEAEASLRKAGPVAQQDATTDLKLAAQRLLSEARRQYDAANYRDAAKAAIESKLNSEKALAVSRGESAREVQFYRVEGDVKVKRVRELIWVDAERGMPLSAGDQVKTSSRASAQIIYFNGTITTIKPGSLLEIKDLYDNPVTRVQQVRERLREGRITASTQSPAAAGSYHEIATQNTVAKSEERTDFEVGYDKEAQTTELRVTMGAATLSAGEAAPIRVGAAEKVDVDKEARPGSVTKIPAVPVMATPPDQKIFLVKDGKPPAVELSWEPLEGAVHYRLQIASQPLFSQTIVDLASLATTSATLPEVHEGGYYWRIAATYRDGTTSPFSAARKFKVIPGNLAAAGDTSPPMLQVDDFLVFSSQVIIRGKTEAGALLTVAGNRVDVYDDGTFTTVVSLRHEGTNTVAFVAQDMAGNERRVEKTAVVDAY